MGVRRTVLVGITAALCGPAPGASQVTLDQGAFTLSVHGQPYGTETFLIRRAGTGNDTRVVATGEIRLQDASGVREMAVRLQAVGPEMTPSAYEIKISGVMQEHVRIERDGSRLVSAVVSDRGERVREYRASPDALLREQDVAHHFFFLGRRLVEGGDFAAPVIVPRAGRQIDVGVSEVGTESLAIGGGNVLARRLRVTEGTEISHVWIDAEGRVLAVEIPGTGYRAVRQEPPI